MAPADGCSHRGCNEALSHHASGSPHGEGGSGLVGLPVVRLSQPLPASPVHIAGERSPGGPPPPVSLTRPEAGRIHPF